MEDGLMISVVMPVYNVEKYLDKAVESVLGQTYGNLELILVDDCSPDGSGKLCDEWAVRDSRVRVVHKPKNEGLGFARNTGMQYSKGDFIIFMDSDDWIESTMLEDMADAALKQKSDIVVCGYSQDYTDEKGEVEYSVKVSISPIIADGHQEVLKAAIEIDYAKLFSFAWNKMYSFSLIKNSGCLFTKTKLIEDFLFNIAIFGYANRISAISKIYYHYLKPTHGTLISAYCENYQEIIDMRFEQAKKSLVQASVYEGKTRSLLSYIYVKHIFAKLDRDCWPESRMNFKKRHSSVKALLRHENVKEALQYSQSYSHSAYLMNAVLKTRNAFIITIAAKWIWVVKNKLPKLFNMIKQR